MKRVNSATEVSKSITSRQAAVLEESLHRRLASYAMAAGAAGVGLLASATPAAADITFTRVNSPLALGYNVLTLVPSHGVDFIVFDLGGVNSTCCGREEFVNGRLMATASGRFFGSYNYNGVMLSNHGVADLPSGALIGPSGLFGRHGTMASFRATCGPGWPCQPLHDEPWPWNRGGSGFLGLELTIDDQNHFGWARLAFVRPDLHEGGYDGIVSAYAYETVPNEPIRAGQGIPVCEPCTLGLLALGSLGLGLWRRKQGGGESQLRD